MFRKIREWISVQLSKNPGRMVLYTILVFNIVFLLLSALVISRLSLSGTEEMGFFEAAFCTITMILDAGCIQFVISDIGSSGVALVVVCLVIIFIGMISFTGAIIGYITSYITRFIEGQNNRSKKLRVSGHLVILNWNTRASEIINDLLYAKGKHTVVILSGADKDSIEKEIHERLADTIARENKDLRKRYRALPPFKRHMEELRNRFKNNINVVVRQGDVFSSKQLHDISLEYAATVIILGQDVNAVSCLYGLKERYEENAKGNSLTVKTLMQVADITGAEYSDNGQKIIVEITDDWTKEIVNRIISFKEVAGKCSIVPVYVNKILGQILSQFSLMPELNTAYRELFSNKGATFFSERQPLEECDEFRSLYLNTHACAIPLAFLESRGVPHCYYVAGAQSDILKTSLPVPETCSVSLNRNYTRERKNVIILGHNSKCENIMDGFQAYINEWGIKGKESDALNILVIDDKKTLDKYEHYEKYPFVVDTVEADIYDKDLICATIEKYVSEREGDVSILILSDDSVQSDNLDANALANLVYVQDMKEQKKRQDPNFDVESIDVIVEIVDPKHYDIVNSYCVNNVVISNRYISKMITQVGEKEALFDFFSDILTYDDGDSDEYQSNELYIKRADSFFTALPEECTAAQLIRSVYETSLAESRSSGDICPTIVLGYVKPGGTMVIFNGNQTKTRVKLAQGDKLIVFSAH